MFGHLHGRHDRERGCGPRGGRGSLNRFAEDFAARWGETQRGGGNRRRIFDGGELRLVLLKMIGDAPRHGYDLIKSIEELTGVAYSPSPGMVYPALTMLDEMGLIGEQQSEGAKKRFAITDTGTEHLAKRAEEVAGLLDRLRALGEHRERTDGAPIRRAMGNLKVALSDRLGRGEFSEETLHGVAALIDEVAQKIERLK